MTIEPDCNDICVNGQCFGNKCICDNGYIETDVTKDTCIGDKLKWINNKCLYIDNSIDKTKCLRYGFLG